MHIRSPNVVTNICTASHSQGGSGLSGRCFLAFFSCYFLVHVHDAHLLAVRKICVIFLNIHDAHLLCTYCRYMMCAYAQYHISATCVWHIHRVIYLHLIRRISAATLQHIFTIHSQGGCGTTYTYMSPMPYTPHHIARGGGALPYAH